MGTGREIQLPANSRIVPLVGNNYPNLPDSGKLIEPIKHNWPSIIEEIERHVSRYKLALMMHRQYNQITQWARGSTVSHYDGEMLLLIRATYCPAAIQNPAESSKHDRI